MGLYIDEIGREHPHAAVGILSIAFHDLRQTILGDSTQDTATILERKRGALSSVWRTHSVDEESMIWSPRQTRNDQTGRPLCKNLARDAFRVESDEIRAFAVPT